MDEDNKPTGMFKEFLMKPISGTENTSVNNLIQHSLRNNYSGHNKKGNNPSRFGNGVELADAIMSTEIEQQGNIFRITNAVEGKNTKATYGINGNTEAEVERYVENGFTKFRVKVYETEMSTNQRKLVGNKEQMPDLQSVERALEQMKGMQYPSTSTSSNKGGSRTDRHNNPAAFTTSIASQGGLVEGRDYTVGDEFSGSGNRTYNTATLIGDPIEKTIKVIDNIGFYTKDNKPRWSYTGDLDIDNWDNMNYDEKKEVIKKMYQHEGGKSLNNLFNT